MKPKSINEYIIVAQFFLRYAQNNLYRLDIIHQGQEYRSAQAVDLPLDFSEKKGYGFQAEYSTGDHHPHRE